MSAPPLIAHIIFRLDVGGLENGLVNLINHMDGSAYRHAIICLKGYSDFKERVDSAKDVSIFSLDKRDGKDFSSYGRLWRLLRQLRPDIVHTRNLSTLDYLFPAYAAGVPRLIHGEHGWDMIDLDGAKSRYRWLRRISSILVSQFIALSRDLERWLVDDVGIDERKVIRIVNGVNTQRFVPAGSDLIKNHANFPADAFVVGTVGRMQPVKDPMNLARAFVDLVSKQDVLSDKACLVMIGSGPNRPEVQSLLDQAGLSDRVWLPGKRNDIPELLQSFDVFVLPSLKEGVSNTILEAMSTGLPVIATDVGGNPDLVGDDTGLLVPARDPAALSHAIRQYLEDPRLRQQHGVNARSRVERHFSLDKMVDKYVSVYDEVREI